MSTDHALESHLRNDAHCEDFAGQWTHSVCMVFTVVGVDKETCAKMRKEAIASCRESNGESETEAEKEDHKLLSERTGA